MNHPYSHQPPHFTPQTPSPPYHHAHTMPQPFQVHPQPTYQPTYLTPEPKTERIMYKSTIQPTTASQQMRGMGLGRLENMGRFIREEDEPSRRTQNTAVFQPPKQNILSFRTQRPERTKMASSVIFFNKTPQAHCQVFPTSTSGRGEERLPFSSGFESLMSKARTVKEETVDSQKSKNNIDIVMEGGLRRQERNFQAQDQKVWRSQIMTSGSSTFPQFPVKDVKQLQFSRNNQTTFQVPKKENNAPSDHQQIKNPVPTQESPKEPEKKEEKKTSPDIKAPPVQLAGMFKKKSPYISSDSGKTDENLLKILGIHPKKSPSKDILKTSSPDPQPATIIPPFISQKPEVKPSPKVFSKSDFKIGKKMGKGQFGEVMLVQHKQTGFLCGMKVMNKREIKLQKYQNQIARQLSIQFFLSHRNIAPLYGYFEDQENVYLLVEFCTDGQLLELLRKNRRMEEADVSPIMREICQGLDYIHREEIIHRDVKPQNILFNFGTVKISDFGWAVHSGNGMRRTISGSPLYYSPEIVMETEYNQKIDLWSIGMMTYECLLGKIPFRIYSELDLNRIVEDDITFPEYVDVSDEAKDFILQIMKKKPEERLELRQMLKHPFITKYPREKQVPSAILEEFRKVLKL